MHFFLFFFIFLFPLFSKEKQCDNLNYFLSAAFYYQSLNEKNKDDNNLKAIENFEKYLECNKEEKSPIVYLQKAKSEIEAKKLKKAESTLNQLQEFAPLVRELYLLKTKIYYETNRIKDAVSLLESNIHYFPEDMEMIYFLAYSYYILNKFDFAKLYLIYLDEIIQSKPNEGYSYKASTINLLIKICLKVGDFTNGLIYLKTYLEKNIYDFSKKLSFIKILSYKGQYNKALDEIYELRKRFKKSSHVDEVFVELLYLTKSKELEEFLENPQTIYEGNFFKSLKYIKDKNFKKARKLLKELIDESPQKIAYLQALYEVYKLELNKEEEKKVLTDAVKLSFRLKNYNKQEEFLLKLLKLDLTEDEILATYYRLSENYDIKEDYEKSINYLNKALKLAKNQTLADLKLKLAYTYQLNKEYSKSEEILQQMREKKLSKAHTFYLLSLARIHETKYDEAIKYLNEAINLDDKNALYYFYRASVFEEMGNKNELEKDLLKSIQLAPENFMSYNYLGYFYAEESIKLDRSVELLKQVIENDPLDENYQDSLGWAYFKQNNLEKSFFHLNLAIKLMNQKNVHNGVIYKHFADVCMKQKKFLKAKTYYIKAKNHTKEKKLTKEIEEALSQIN